MAEALLKQIEELIGTLRSVGKDSQTCEVKEAVGDPKSLPDTVSAFANTQGGVILLGLSERDGFRPCPKFDAQAAYSALQMLGDALTPVVRLRLAILPFEESRIVVAVVPELPAEEKPCFVTLKGTYGGSFVRTGDGDRRLSEYEVSRMLETRHQPQHDLEVVEDADLRDLDSDRVRQFVERQRGLSPRIFSKMTDEEILLKNKVIAYSHERMRPTLAGLLALGTFPQEFFPRLCVVCTLYADVDSRHPEAEPAYRYVDTKRLVGPIPDLVADAVDYVAKNMHYKARIVGAFRTDVPDYPLVAVRETVANALQHRDYSPVGRGAHVQVNLYSDRLEVLNPGGLYGATNVTSVLHSSLSTTRNVYLSQILENTAMEDGTRVVENRGTGMRTIQGSYASVEPSPIHVESTWEYFRIALSKEGKGFQQTRRKWKDVPQEMMRAFSQEETISISEFCAMSGLSRLTVRKYVLGLIREGRIEPTEPSRSPKQRYRLRNGS